MARHRGRKRIKNFTIWSNPKSDVMITHEKGTKKYYFHRLYKKGVETGSIVPSGIRHWEKVEHLKRSEE